MTSRSAPPYAIAATAAAQAPVPDASVGSDASLPDQDPHAPRRLDGREFHVGAGREVRMHGKLCRQAVQAFFA